MLSRVQSSHPGSKHALAEGTGSAVDFLHKPAPFLRQIFRNVAIDVRFHGKHSFQFDHVLFIQPYSLSRAMRRHQSSLS